MTERLADIRARINGVRQLGAVVNAMRGIAAARVQQARSQLTAVDAYAGTIASAIGRILSIIPADRPKDAHESSRLALVLFGAEQGFAGAFSERVLDDAGDDLVTSSLFLIGTRGSVVASERGLAVDWQSAMPSHSPGVPKLASRIADALYAHIATGKVDRLDVIFSEWHPGRGIHVERRRLFPFDRTQFHDGGIATDMPLLNLAPDALLRELASEYLHAQICNAALHAFAAEHQARMEAMAAARSQIERELTSLEATQRHIRQEEITAEIIELAAGETASRSDRDQAGYRARHQRNGPAIPDVRSPLP